MSELTRKFVRRCVWSVLVVCVVFDAALGEAAISGSGDVGYQKADGTWSFPGPDPTLWRWIVGFILIQGAFILAIIRLRDKEQPRSLFLSQR